MIPMDDEGGGGFAPPLQPPREPVGYLRSDDPSFAPPMMARDFPVPQLIQRYYDLYGWNDPMTGLPIEPSARMPGFNEGSPGAQGRYGAPMLTPAQQALIQLASKISESPGSSGYPPNVASGAGVGLSPPALPGENRFNPPQAGGGDKAVAVQRMILEDPNIQRAARIYGVDVGDLGTRTINHLVHELVNNQNVDPNHLPGGDQLFDLLNSPQTGGAWRGLLDKAILASIADTHIARYGARDVQGAPMPATYSNANRNTLPMPIGRNEPSRSPGGFAPPLSGAGIFYGTLPTAGRRPTEPGVTDYTRIPVVQQAIERVRTLKGTVTQQEINQIISNYQRMQR